MAKTEVKFNLLTILLIAVLIFIAGYASHRGVKYSKEIKALKVEVVARQDTIKVLSDSLALLKAEAEGLLVAMIDNDKRIAAYQASIKHISNELAEVRINNADIPPSVKYDSLITVTGIAEQPQPYPFSEGQLGALFDIYSSTWLLQENIDQYEDYTSVLLSNYVECEELNSNYENQIILYKEQDIQKTEIINNKDEQIRTVKKVANRNGVAAVIFGGITILLAIIGTSN